MTNYFKRLEIGDWKKHINLQSLISILLLLIPIIYLATLAQQPIFGDPTEYTFIAHILGIAHPPGYAFITTTGHLFQKLIPFGDISWRMHLFSATLAAVAAFFVYGAVKGIGYWGLEIRDWRLKITAVFAAFIVAFQTNHWQHAIHANPHIITATFLAANLFFLTKWAMSRDRGSGGRDQHHASLSTQHSALSPQSSALSPQSSSLSTQSSDRWLYAFCFSAGLGVTHHPLTVFGFPAYAAFILLIRPSILKEWRTLLKMVGIALLGLSLWLYYPLRSPHVPFGPTGMNTLDGFLNHVLGRGITEGLPYFTLAEQPHRALVFWSLLRLQYSLPVIFLAILGVILPYYEGVKGWLGERVTNHPLTSSPLHLVTRSLRHPVTLYVMAFLSFYAFVISLKAQDIMAYLLGPLLIVGLLAGVGLLYLLQLLSERLDLSARWATAVLVILFLLGPVAQLGRNLPRISLRDYDEAARYVDAVFTDFDGQGATLLNDWEHMTPMWYAEFVENRRPDGEDVTAVLVSTAKPWVEFVFDYLPGGAVYLSNYRRDVVDAGFRLRPYSAFYQVVEPGDTTIPPHLTAAQATGEQIEVVGYELPATAVTAGDYIPIILALRAPITPTHYYVPSLRVGGIEYTFTTDSHLITPTWLPNEVVVERFDIALPPDLPSGTYPVTLDLKNLSTDTAVPLDLILGELTVNGQDRPIPTDHLLANFRQQVGLVGATGNGRSAPWTEPLTAQPGDIVNLILRWQSLGTAAEGYTIFIHLIDHANRPLVDNLDYTPLGGAFPTHLWFPKWLPGQQFYDPYRLQIPPDLPPGEYLIEVGIYEMVGKRRLHIADQQGNLVGDRYILGAVRVE